MNDEEKAKTEKLVNQLTSGQQMQAIQILNAVDKIESMLLGDMTSAGGNGPITLTEREHEIIGAITAVLITEMQMLAAVIAEKFVAKEGAGAL